MPLAAPQSGDPTAAVRSDIEAAPELAPLLEAVSASLSAGEVVATVGHIRIRGVTDRGPQFEDALARLEAAAGGGPVVVADVFTIDTRKPASLLCRELFVASTRQPVRFQQAGDALRSSSYAALDRLVEFSADCPGAKITIVGHSDSVGDPAFNLDLSRRRAAAVARYLVDRGVAAERLEVRGAGSSDPVADNATSFGRRQNRRIEFSVSLPD